MFSDSDKGIPLTNNLSEKENQVYIGMNDIGKKKKSNNNSSFVTALLVEKTALRVTSHIS